MSQRNSSAASVLGSLRALIPSHSRVTGAEALRIAERQANLLLELHNVTSAPVPKSIISSLPKVEVEDTDRLVWGATYWDKNRQAWIIQLSRAEPPSHRRFILAHEYKHIIDHGRQDQLYRGTKRVSPTAQAEQAADYFAACLLVPRQFLKSAWAEGIRTTGELADMFRVSEYTIGNRLRQTRLADYRHLRHLPSPLPFIADDEVAPQLDREEGVLPG